MFLLIVPFSSVYSQPFAHTWETLSNYKCADLYKNAKFGIFIYWGVYSVPAFGSECYPHWMYRDTLVWDSNYYQHHVAIYGTPDKLGYKDFIPIV